MNDDNPHLISEIGTEYWFDDNGEYHREDGPAIVQPDGMKLWYKHGKKHRDGGPAVEYVNRSQTWFKNGKRHREDGPAMIHEGGGKYWFFNNYEITSYKEFQDLTGHSDAYIAYLKLKYGKMEV